MAQNVKRDDGRPTPLQARKDGCRSATPDAGTPMLPPDNHFVSLTHALTWIAFGISMDNEHLHEVLNLDRFGDHDVIAGLTEAVACLAEEGSAGRVALLGKHCSHHEASRLLNERIEPFRLTDYCKFSYFEDELRYGEGLLISCDDSALLDDVFGIDHADSYVDVTVSRADLLRRFRPHGPMGWEPQAIHWSDLASPSLERARELAREAETDEWWNWPQAAAWAGARNLEHIATMRLTAEQWRCERGYDPAVALGAERILGATYCADPEGTERDLIRAIERGAIRTLGRQTVDSPSRELEPLDWRGGKVVYNRTATLVSASNMLSEWACDIAVNRANLCKVFPAVNEGKGGEGGGKVPANRQLNHDAIRDRAAELRAGDPHLKIGPAAASIIAEIGHNPKTRKPWDHRGIEKLIAPLWKGDEENVPPTIHIPPVQRRTNPV